MKNKFVRLLPLVLLLCIYALSVFPGIIKGYTAFTFDNGRDMLVTYRLIYEKKLTLIGPTTGIDGVFHGAWWYYFLVIPFLLFQGNPQGVVFSVAICGLLGLIILYFLLRKMFNQRMAFLGGLIYATSPEIIGRYSQIGHNDLEVFLGILSLLFLYLYVKSERKNNIFLGLFGLMSAFIFEFEFAYGMFILAFSILFFFIFFCRGVKKFIWFFAFLFVPLIPRILFELKHGFLMTKTLVNYFFHPVARMYNGGLQDRFFNRASIFSQFWKDLFRPELAFLAAVALILVVIFIPQIIKTKDKKLKSIGIFSIGVSLFIFICFLYYKDVIWGNYLNGIMVYFITLVCFAVFFLEKKIKFGKYLTFLAAFLIFFSFAFNFKNNLAKREWLGDYSVMRNQLEIINSVKNDSINSNFGLGVYSASGFSYPYDYWFLWFEKFHQIPRPKSLWHDKINYLIIEPDDRKILIDKWMERNMDKNAKLLERIKIVDVVVEKWKLD